MTQITHCISFTLALLALAATTFAASPPNIVFVIADQWRAQAFGFAGDPNVKTPNLDRLERESIHFTQAISRTPVCSPARASLLTGQRPLTHGVFLNDVPLSTNAPTIAKILGAAGYDTACIGKWHVDGHGRTSFIPRERRQGFDYWKVLECTHDYHRSFYYADGPDKLQWEGYDAIAQTRDAQCYLESQAKSRRPFLLWLSFGPPHSPYNTAPTNYRALYRPEKIQLPANVPPEAQSRAREDLAGYYAHCTALDDCVGDLLATLKQTGLAENTIVVFTSDHGDMLGAHALQKKQKPYEESVRVPLLLRLPANLKIKPQRLTGTINTEDVLPTLLGLCKVSIPKTIDGLDFTRYLRGGPDPSGGAASIQSLSPFGEFSRLNGGREYRGIRTARYTYVRDLTGPWLLFDNVQDPLQLTNLIGRAEHAVLEQRLDKQLKKKLTAEHDEFRPGSEYIRKWNYQVDRSGTVAE